MKADGEMNREEAPARGLAEERRAREKAEAELAGKSELLATVSHELRTALGELIAMADLLLTTGLDATQRQYAGTLQQSARNLVHLLSDVLDHEKLAAGKLELAPRDVDLAAFLDGVETALKARAQARGLTGCLTRDPELPGCIRIDAMRLRQMIGNLVDNAIKFTAQGSVTVDVRFEPVAAHDGILRIAVADTGIGMDQEEQARLFRPFSQAHAGTAAQFGGTGLGLAIVSRLAGIMRAELAVTSAPDKGSVFTLAIPCPSAETSQSSLSGEAQQEAGPGTPGPGELAAPAQPDGPRPRVLVVEDNRVNQTLLATYLTTFGMDCRIAPDGASALQALRGGSFDVVLMDIRMRGLDGVATMRAIRALPAAVAAVPIIATTADALRGDREKILQAGFDHYVAKPIDPRELYRVILEVRHGASAARRQA